MRQDESSSEYHTGTEIIGGGVIYFVRPMVRG